MNRSSRIAVKHNRQQTRNAGHGAADASASTTPDADDFEAIEQAVMATPRGRWFLSEYLRRHQNDETRRLVRALRKLATVGNEDVSRYRAVLEQERAALDGIRLLLARTADTLAEAAGKAAAEPALPEAAASRLAEVLRSALAETGRHDKMLKTLAHMFHELARLLGEAMPESIPAPDTTVSIVPARAHQQPAGAEKEQTSSSPDSERKGARIVIRQHGDSQEVDIPLPETASSSAQDASGQTRRGVVRIRRRHEKIDHESVASRPHQQDKVQPATTHALAEDASQTG